MIYSLNASAHRGARQTKGVKSAGLLGINTPQGDNLQKSSTTHGGMVIFQVGVGMKYWITTFQATGIALFAGAIVATPRADSAIFWGVWLILIGYFFHSLTGGKQ